MLKRRKKLKKVEEPKSEPVTEPIVATPTERQPPVEAELPTEAGPAYKIAYKKASEPHQREIICDGPQAEHDVKILISQLAGSGFIHITRVK